MNASGANEELLPNLGDFYPLQGSAIGELNLVMGDFGLVPGIEDAQLAIGERGLGTDPNDDRGVIEFRSLTLRDASGAPAVIAALRAYPGAPGGPNMDRIVVKDGPDHLLTGPAGAPQAGPQVKSFKAEGGQMKQVANFYAYRTLKYGVNVAAGDLDGDGLSEIVTGAGPGAVFGPQVRAFRYDPDAPRGAIKPMSAVNFFAFQTMKGGVGVELADRDGDYRAEIYATPGSMPNFPPQIREFKLDANGRLAAGKLNVVLPKGRGGVSMTSGDVDGDRREEIYAWTPGSRSVAVLVRDEGPMDTWEPFSTGIVGGVGVFLRAGIDRDYWGQSSRNWPIYLQVKHGHIKKFRMDYVFDFPQCRDEGTMVWQTPLGARIRPDGTFQFSYYDLQSQVYVDVFGKFERADRISGVMRATSGRCGGQGYGMLFFTDRL